MRAREGAQHVGDRPAVAGALAVADIVGVEGGVVEPDQQRGVVGDGGTEGQPHGVDLLWAAGLCGQQPCHVVFVRIDAVSADGLSPHALDAEAALEIEAHGGLVAAEHGQLQPGQAPLGCPDVQTTEELRADAPAAEGTQYAHDDVRGVRDAALSARLRGQVAHQRAVFLGREQEIPAAFGVPEHRFDLREVFWPLAGLVEHAVRLMVQPVLQRPEALGILRGQRFVLHGGFLRDNWWGEE